MIDGKANWEAVRKLIEDETGPIRATQDISDGRNSEISVLIHTDDDSVFVKGRKADHPQAWTQARERAINPSVIHLSPWLKWSTRDSEWDLLGFEYMVGRHVGYTPGSPDIPMIMHTLHELQQVPCPNIEMKRAEQRWSVYTDTPELFIGNHLLHTDWSPSNVLMNGRAYLVDWAWPTKGAGFIDPACLAVWLIASDHDPQAAESLITRIPSWREARKEAKDEFVRVQARMWADIAAESAYSWTRDLAHASQRWIRFRDA